MILPEKTYLYNGEGFGGSFTITLYEDGTFTYYEGMLSSYIGTGSFMLDGDTVIMTDDGHGGYGLVNHFRHDGDDLVFIEQDSDNFVYVKVKDGEKFHCTGEAFKLNDMTAVVIKWFDYLETPDEMKWDGSIDINLPEFPDVTFRWTYGEIVAVKGNKTTSLYTGMPIWNTYFCDLTGDGLPEFCSTISWGSGMIDNMVMDDAVDVRECCRKAEELFELYQSCANRKQIETICTNFLRGIEATKLSITGHMYFVPRTYMERVDIFEDFITLLSGLNKKQTPLVVNSFYIIDDAKQRDKMTEEFYLAVKKEIATYQEKCDYLIKSGSQSPAVMDRWVLKVQALEQKKRHYEGVLQRELDGLDDEFSVLKFLSQELQVRANSIRSQRFPTKKAA